MAFRKLGKGAVIAITLTATLLILTTAGLLTTNQTLSTTGTISSINLDVFSDAASTIPLNTVNWGNLAPGGQATKTIYIKNTGNVAETLTMTTNNWSPSNAGSYLTVTWSPASSALLPGQSTSATLTLSASSGAGALTTFSVNIVITGTQ